MRRLYMERCTVYVQRSAGATGIVQEQFASGAVKGCFITFLQVAYGLQYGSQ